MKYKPQVNMKRIFIAVKIDPTEALKTMFSDFRTGLKDERIKWTEMEKFHITLVFLGDTEEDKIESVSEMLKGVCMGFGDFSITIKGTGLFKNLKDPRVIWTGVEPSEKLIKLHESVKLGLKDTDITIEDRPYRPHLTLGRINNIKDIETLKALITRYQNTDIQRQAVYEVILYESLLMHSGAVYKPLGKYPLVDK